MNAREMRGRAIAEAKNQIARIDDNTYRVRSQSADRMYDVVRAERSQRW